VHGYDSRVDIAQFRTPGQLIDALLTERGWTKRVLSIVLGLDEAVVTRLVADKRRIDAQMALHLGEVFDVKPEEFINRQTALDMVVARYKVTPDPARATRAALFGDLPVSDMIKRGWLQATMADPKTVETALVKFFGVDSVADIEILPHAAKKTNTFAPATPAQMAWIYRVKQIAADMLVARYSPASARAAVEALKALRAEADEVRHVPRVLTEHGIRFVLVEALPSTKIDGVCFWLNDFAPVVAMSMRHDRIDNFWFVLRHELEHVIQRHGRGAVMLDSDLDGPQGDVIAEEESVANAAAASFCVPADRLEQFIARKAPFFADKDVLGFARTLKVHPGLVAGQVRRYTGRYNLLHQHLVKVRSVVAPNAMKDGWGDVAPVDV
jgi:HTH-type transcriptional regulator/antitoxin HigA